MLLGNAYDDSEDEETAPQAVPLALQPASREDVEQSAESEDEASEGEEASGVVPVALSSAADAADDEDEEEEEAARQAAAEAAARAAAAEAARVAELPPPDFTGWVPAGGGAPSARTAPLVGGRSKKRKGPGGGASQISSGFKAAVTRHDALEAQKEAELELELEERKKNNGLSAAYDSVFRSGPRSRRDHAEITRGHTRSPEITSSAAAGSVTPHAPARESPHPQGLQGSHLQPLID